MSEHFYAMFHNRGFIESSLDEVIIHDVPFEILELMVEYMYTGKRGVPLPDPSVPLPEPRRLRDHLILLGHLFIETLPFYLFLLFFLNNYYLLSFILFCFIFLFYYSFIYLYFIYFYL